MSGISDDAKRNRANWTKANAEFTDGRASHAWAAEEITWGVFRVSEASLNTLGKVDGLDVVELGCGTAYVSAWLARRGARPVGVDVTPAQLATARRCQREFGIGFPLVEASAESVPLSSGSFDLAISEYGASIWCDPRLWIPEAHRLLRSGGRLWFLRNSTLSTLCARDEGPPAEMLQRPQRGLGRLEWPRETGVEWQLPHGELFRLLRGSGFDVVDLVELYPPEGAIDPAYYDTFSVEWARKWPSEEIWVAEKRGSAPVAVSRIPRETEVAIAEPGDAGDMRFRHAPPDWTPQAALETARREGLELGEDHWEALNALQEYYARHEGGVIRRRVLHDALDEKFHYKGGLRFLYMLFPGGPVAQGCRLAGLEPPSGAFDPSYGSVA